MIYYKKLSGQFAPAEAPDLPITPEGQAMGHIPGWLALLDPDYLVGDNGIRNRALPRNVSINPGGMVVVDQFPNGESAFHPTAANTLLPTAQARLNPDAWTVFTVVNDLENNPAGGAKGLVVGPVDEEFDIVSLQLGFSQSGGNVIIWENSSRSAGQPTRLYYSAGLQYRTGPTLLMYTFSTRDGLRIFDNGELRASAPDDRRPLNFGVDPGKWEFFRLSRNQWGMTGVLNIDLGWDEHTGYRNAIERFIMHKYSIV